MSIGGVGTGVAARLRPAHGQGRGWAAGAGTWWRKTVLAVLALFSPVVGWAAPRVLLPPGEDASVWEEALTVAGLEAGPPREGEPGVFILRVDGGWQLEALDGFGGRRSLQIAAPTTATEREALAVVARSLTRPVQAPPKPAPPPIRPKPAPPPAPPPPAPPPTPELAVAPSIPAPLVVASPPRLAGLRVHASGGLQLGGHSPAAAGRLGLVVGTGWLGAGPVLTGQLGARLREDDVTDVDSGGVPGAGPRRAQRGWGGALLGGLRGPGRAPSLLAGVGAEQRIFVQDGSRIAEVWLPTAQLQLSTGWGGEGRSAAPRPGAALVTDLWGAWDLRSVVVQVGDGPSAALPRWSAGLSLGIRWDVRAP